MEKEYIKNILMSPFSSASRKWIKKYYEDKSVEKIKLVMTLVCRNEEDIIEQNIRFHCSMGVDGFIVTSHNSDDKTDEILERLKEEGLVLEILYKKTPDHKHHIWVDEMVKLAKNKYNADWVINGDADEFFYSQILNLKKSIYEYSKNGINALYVESTFCFPQNIDNFLENKYFRKPIYLDPENPTQYKIAFCPKLIHNTKDYICVTDGNHFTKMRNIKQVPCANIILYHFHVKNYKGYEAKVLRWMDSAQYMKDSQGGHVKNMIKLYKEGKLRADYDEKFNEQKRQELLENGVLYIDKNLSLYLKDKGII